MWYLAEILFAEPSRADRDACQCESCNVVLCAASAVEAYRRAISWGMDRAAQPPAAMRLLGVSHLTSIGEELGDGIEICGRFFEAPRVWDRADEIVPPPHQLKAIQWERGSNTPIGKLLSPEQIAQLKRAWGEDE